MGGAATERVWELADATRTARLTLALTLTLNLTLTLTLTLTLNPTLSLTLTTTTATTLTRLAAAIRAALLALPPGAVCIDVGEGALCACLAAGMAQAGQGLS